MNRSLRECLACVSLCSFVASAASYLMGFSESTAEAARRGVGFLMIILLVDWVILLAAAYPTLRAPFAPFAWWKGPPFMSRRAILFHRFLLIVAMTQAAWCFWKIRHGVSAVIDGQYVLESNGIVLQVVSRSEYFSVLKGEVRWGASVLLYLYFLPLVYWWHNENEGNLPTGLTRVSSRLPGICHQKLISSGAPHPNSPPA